MSPRNVSVEDRMDEVRITMSKARAKKLVDLLRVYKAPGTISEDRAARAEDERLLQCDLRADELQRVAGRALRRHAVDLASAIRSIGVK